jgi:hypothetical protein
MNDIYFALVYVNRSNIVHVIDQDPKLLDILTEEGEKKVSQNQIDTSCY